MEQTEPVVGKGKSAGKAVRRFVHRLAFSDRLSGVVMLLFAVAGLVLANTPATSGFVAQAEQFRLGIPVAGLSMSVRDWCQNGLLTIFFLVVGLELKQELTTGSLSEPKKAIVPMLAAVGGMLAPSCVYLAVLLVAKLSGSMASYGLAVHEVFHGWAVPTATDIAFSLAVFALFSKGLPSGIRSFLLTLATVDDFLGILLIAILFTSFGQWYWFAGTLLAGVAWYFLVRAPKVPRWLAGALMVVLWYLAERSGVHPTLAGALVGLLAPAKPVRGEEISRAQRWHDGLTPLSVLVALPFFAFFATAVDFKGYPDDVLVSPVVIGIVAGLVVGKPLGVMLTSWLCVHVGHLKLADGLKVRDLVGMACSCGIGFTVSFLIAALAFASPRLVGEARLAVLLGSAASACVAGIVLRLQSRNLRRR